MKTAEFFIKKANTYLEIINEIIVNPRSSLVFDDSGDHMSNIHKFSIYNDNPTEDAVQKLKTEELLFKIKLLVSEFDNGKLFLDEIEKKNNESVYEKFVDKNIELKIYKHILNLFIDHLNEFRKTNND